MRPVSIFTTASYLEFEAVRSENVEFFAGVPYIFLGVEMKHVRFNGIPKDPWEDCIFT